MLVYLAIIVAIMIAGATLLTKGTVALMGKLGGETIFRLHKSAESIVTDLKVPVQWRRKLEKRYPGLRDVCEDEAKKTAHREQARRLCLRQLDKLIVHFTKTSAVVDEEAREILLAELERAIDLWESHSWDEITT